MSAFKFERTRIAPTPSGFLHLGNVVSFVRTVGLAKEAGAKVLLRIDDMDRVRAEREYVQDIFDTLNFLELPWGEGPRDVEEFEREYSQVYRMGLYKEGLEMLRGKVFACECSRAQVLRDSQDGVYAGTCREKAISLDAEGVSWRLRTDDLGGSMKDFVVRKRDGFPAYQLTSVIDDLYYKVDFVVRGEDLLASTAAQRYLAGQMGRGVEFGKIGFYHHSLLMTEGGRKLSKSAGDTSIQYLRKEGLTKEEIYGRLAGLLGLGSARNWEELYNQLYE
ncbi:MAG: tRNA glutamyl-Q synthetase [Bacteroidetes bacterium]|nr:tRNA glutamyl-Q synthetase [Bacteroidota bacterium]